MDILEKIISWAEQEPQRVAICYLGENVTYAQLIKEIQGISEVIKGKLGNSENQPIAIVMERSLTFIRCMLGVMLSKNYYIPIELPIPDERIAFILKNSQCKLVLSQVENQIIYEEKKYLLSSSQTTEKN